MTEFKSNAETLNSTPENSTAPELHCYWCGGDCTGRFDLIHVPGRNATVCKGSFGDKSGCWSVGTSHQR